MKIWVIGRNYPTTKNKMCGSFEYEQAQILAKNGHEVCYITCPFHPIYKIKKWGAFDWQEDDVHIYAYSQFYFPQRMNIFWDSFKMRKWETLLSQVENEQGTPDIIHLHYPALISVPEAVLAFKARGTKVIITEHLTDVLTEKITDHARKQLKIYVENADHFICVGQPLKESVKKLTGTNKQIEVIPNAVTETFNCERIAHKGFNFISIGRLVKVKQFDRLINAFAKAFSKEEDVSLTIVGGGFQQRNLQNLINKLGLNERIFLTGTQKRSEVAKLMSKADVLVTFSRLETFGVPVIEGWYCGLPAIATTAIGFSEYWKEELGELISFDDDSQLIRAMVKVKNTYELYSKNEIQNYSKRFFSEAAVYEKLINLYNT